MKASKLQQMPVSHENIWVDPGIGFAKDTAQNIVVMQGLQKIAELGYPQLLGTSRKSMIGNVLELPVEERLEGTSATVCYGIEKGCHIIRVHDVKEIARAVKMMDVLTGKLHIRDRGMPIGLYSFERNGVLRVPRCIAGRDKAWSAFSCDSITRNES